MASHRRPGVDKEILFEPALLRAMVRVFAFSRRESAATLRNKEVHGAEIA